MVATVLDRPEFERARGRVVDGGERHQARRSSYQRGSRRRGVDNVGLMRQRHAVREHAQGAFHAI